MLGLDLEEMVGGYRGRQNKYQHMGKCYVIFQTNPFANEMGMGGGGGGGFGPRRDDHDISHLMKQGAVERYKHDKASPLTPYVVPTPFQQPASQWLPDSRFEPMSPKPFQAPTRESILDAPKPFEQTRVFDAPFEPAKPFKTSPFDTFEPLKQSSVFDKPFEPVKPLYEPLVLKSTAHSFKVFDPEVSTPLMRLDYRRGNDPEHLQYGGAHTPSFRFKSDEPVIAREVFAETLGKTKRPLFNETFLETPPVKKEWHPWNEKLDMFGNPVKKKKFGGEFP